MTTAEFHSRSTTRRARLALVLSAAGMAPAALGAVGVMIGRVARPGSQLPLNTDADYFWIYWLGWSILILVFGMYSAILSVPLAAYAAQQHPSQAMRRVSLALAVVSVVYVAWAAYQRVTAPARFRRRTQELQRETSFQTERLRSKDGPSYNGLKLTIGGMARRVPPLAA